LALSDKGEPADLLLSALSARHPEVRYAAARVLETRGSDDHKQLAAGLVGPKIPDKAADIKNWPSEDDRAQRLAVLVDALASDHPLHRYAAAQVLTLRPQPKAFWRECKNLLGPSGRSRPRIPFTNWDSEDKTPRKKGWIRALFGKGDGQVSAATSETERLLESLGVTPTATSEELGTEAIAKLVFGAYAGLVRQAPTAGEADETHRVRRDSIDRIAALSTSDAIGLEAVLPVLRRALSDPNHLVRRSAVGAVRKLYPADSFEPLRLELTSSAADVGRGAVNELIARSGESEQAMALAKGTINAPVSEVRRYALSQLPQLYESGSIEPWLLAIESRYADVRLNVVDRLVDSTDERVLVALARAMESDHEDLRLKAAEALAKRGDIRTVDVLAGLLFSDDSAWEATEALVDLAHARKNEEAAAAATLALIARLENDPDKTADRHELFDCIERIASPAAAEFLTRVVITEPKEDDDDEDDRSWSLNILIDCLTDRSGPKKYDENGDLLRVFRDVDQATAIAAELVLVKDSSLRLSVAGDLLRDLPGRGGEELLEVLLEDRVEEVRVNAAEVLAHRARYMEGASTGALSSALREGKRELVLPAAEGLAVRQEPEAFQPLLLVLKAGEQDERQRAIVALGNLGDDRALEELEPLVDGSVELEPEDAAMAPFAVEALGRIIPRLDDQPTAERIRALVENLAREGSSQLR
ncbi:MAG: HEAT repeat domain-containing protein, partial [Deltaproteobacteria bacterium]|nr:HEAT repeat domain-containing protein [Deltaproteobacteria bacterium]